MFVQDGGQVSLAEDEHPVGVLTAYGADPALGMGVGRGCLGWRADDLDAGGGEDRVERGVNLVSRSRPAPAGRAGTG